MEHLVASQHQHYHHHSSLLPSLPPDLALLCLSKLPLACRPIARLVCKAWHLAFRCQWLFLPSLAPDHWFSLDPFTRQWSLVASIPSLPLNVGAVHCTWLVVQGSLIAVLHFELAYQQEMYIFQPEVGRWKQLPLTHLHANSSFAYASEGDFLYIAGGTGLFLKGVPTADGLRYSLSRTSWEKLPRMKVPRKECSGCIMNGCFWVVGGISKVPLPSAEYYNPHVKKWTLVDFFWPVYELYGFMGPHPPRPRVVSFNDELYALDFFHRNLLHYDQSANKWIPIGEVPCPAGASWGDALLATLGEEILVACKAIDNRNITTLASKARVPLVWRCFEQLLN